MQQLIPWLDTRVSPLKDIEDISLKDIPEKPGVYIMLSHDTDYVYPWSKAHGTSRVYYIGQSHNLRQRIETHKKFYLEIKDEPRYDYYYPRYEYAYYHRCNVCWATCESRQAAKEAEKLLLVSFAHHYGAKPVANSQSAWE